MNWKHYLIFFIVVLAIIAGSFVYYQEKQKQANAYKTVENVTTDELISNTFSEDQSILVEKVEPATTQKDLSKFDKEITDKHTVYYHNPAENIHVKLVYSNIRLDYERQQGTAYEVKTQEFLSTTGEVQQYQFSTTLTSSEQRVSVEDNIQTVITEALQEDITSIQSVSLVENTTVYQLEDGTEVTVTSNGKIERISSGSTSTTIELDTDEPDVPQIQSEILEENISEES